MDNNNLEVFPSVVGLLHCLRALAQEAATLNLLRTLSAIEDAMEAAAVESGADGERMKRAVLH
jgi:hypothetical protein